VPRIRRAEVERIADLARLTLSEEEAERMTGELERILDYVQALQQLDTEGVPPTSHAVPLATPFREDAPRPGLDPEGALRNAPERDGWAFVVPKVIAEDEA
jgi:aspartyl-tRNA(Asn)/glutamyl-tRNA(Gln) amidotransferase subunit C